MTDAERLVWIDRLEREAFGQRIPDDAAYAARLRRYRVLTLLWMVAAVLCTLLLPLLWSGWWVVAILSGLLYIAIPLLAWGFARQSLTWGWYLRGSTRLVRLSSIPPLASWQALQQSARESDNTELQALANRRWADYQTVLTALGRPPPSAILGRGFGDLLRWLPF